MEIINVPEDDLEEGKLKYIDDTFILKEHKKELINNIKKIYNNMYSWADPILMKCLVLHHYQETISKIDKEAYLSEIQDENVEDMI